MKTRRWGASIRAPLVGGAELLIGIVGGLTGLSAALLTLFALPVAVQAQETGTIRGTVVNEATMRPISGAQVFVVEEEIGTISRGDGQYLLLGVPAGTVSVRVQMLGYGSVEEEVEVEAGQPASVDFTLSQSAINLDEIVVTGTGASTERRQLGNSLSSIDAEGVVQSGAITGFEDLMQARASGVQVLPSGGTVGASGVIRIRGISTLSQAEAPLVYIDGVRMDISSEGGPNVSGQSPSRMVDLIPSDIERVEIIRGAAAATLYGSEASNGVIQIFTKSGRAGEPRWTLQVEQGLERVPENFPGTLYPNFVGPNGVRARDTNELIETGHQQSYSLSLSGGEESLTYYLSGTYRDEEGSVVPAANHLKQGSARMNLSAVPYETLSLRVNMGYVNTRIRLPNNDNSIFGVSGNATAGVPYQATEERRWGENFLPVSEAIRIENMQDVDRFTGGLTVEHQPSDLLGQTLSLGLDLVSQEDTEFFPYGFNGPFYPTGRKENSRRFRDEMTLDYRAVVSNDLSDRFTSSFATGVQGVFTNTSVASVEGRDFPGPGLSLASAGAVITGDESRVEEVNAGLFVEETVGLDDRLFLTGGVRLDGNSAFGNNFRYQTYPKASLAYNVSDEDFWPSSFWPTMKLRVAYGTSGLAPAQFAADRTWEPTSVLGGVAAVTPENVGNPDLTAERSEEIEVGFDAGLLDNRVGLVLTYFRQRTTDALLGVPTSPSLGFTGSQLSNIGEVGNNGFELELTNLWLSREDLEWRTTLNLSVQDNEIVDMGETGEFEHGFGSSARAVEGYPVYGKWLPGELEWDPVERTHSLSGDPVYVGPSIPTHRGSLSTTVTFFGRLSISGLMDWAAGHYVANVTRQFQTQGRTGDAYLELVEAPSGDRTAAGDSLVNYVNTMGTASFISAGDFLKLRELSMSYQIPEAWLQRWSMNSMSLQLSGRNLLTATEYDGVDPEVNWSGADEFVGAEFYTVPPARRISFSIRTTF